MQRTLEVSEPKKRHPRHVSMECLEEDPGKRWYARNPWYAPFKDARRRCTNPAAQKWHSYGGRGIKFELSREDVEFLWQRDRADLQHRPSLDRLDSDGPYNLDNCRFIEWELNRKLGTARQCMAVISTDAQGNEESFLSIRDAARALATGTTKSPSCIRACLCGIQHKAYERTWRYQNDRCRKNTQ